MSCVLALFFFNSVTGDENKKCRYLCGCKKRKKTKIKQKRARKDAVESYRTINWKSESPF